MNASNRNQMPDDLSGPPREGVFDQQLSFSAPYFAAPQPLRTIIKRDGREVSFDKSKIAETIFLAAQSIGGADRDRADSLASGVAIYLSKMLNGQPPTVEQVSDAVEKVLIEMGHAKTALAYARYRDKRARIRKLQEGDIGGLLSELEEARRAGREVPDPDAAPRYVRTSDDRLDGWDRARISDALVRETNMDEGLAQLIALEVEQQILRAGVKTLTASLVRELVDTRLIEHGLEDYRRRHMRLGVPLYDAERIICQPNQGQTEHPQDPHTTNLLLAERVKREFALSQVFSTEVADAHLGGDIHLHNLGQVDCLHTLETSLLYVLAWGFVEPDGRGTPSAPTELDLLLAQTGWFNAALHRHADAGVRWDALNIVLAPYLTDISDAGLRQIARLVLAELAHPAEASDSSSAGVRFSLHWDIPPVYSSAEAVASGGAIMEKTYGDFAHAAHRLAQAFLSICLQPPPGVTLTPTIVVTEGALHDRGFGSFLHRAAELAVARRPLEFALLREDRTEGPDALLWTPREAIAQCVAVNLPRAAFRGGTEQGTREELERLAGIVVRAHADKAAFLRRLMYARNSGPLALFSMGPDEDPYLDPSDFLFGTCPVGLNECVQHLCGQELHESEEAQALGRRLLAYFDEACLHLAEQQDLSTGLVHHETPSPLARFAALDLRQFPEAARAALKVDPMTQDLHYTAGARLSAQSGCSPMDFVRAEGRFHDLYASGASTIVIAPEGDLSGDAVAGFISKSFYRTRAQRITFKG